MGQDLRNNSPTYPVFVQFSAKTSEVFVLLPTNIVQVYGGNYIFTQAGTGYGSIILEILASDGTTWLPLVTKTAADTDGGTAVTLGAGAQVRARAVNMTTSSAKLSRVPA